LSLRYLLDTSTVSAVIAPKPNRLVIQRLGLREQQCAIASVVWNELVDGCNRLPRGKRRAELEAFLHDVVARTFPILPYDQAAATWHGIERARQEGAGRTAPYVHGQIAAVARVNDLILVTANMKDFAGKFSDLVVEDWTTSARGR
jgi:tRNA(fMet)-specific endonuclease VapC